MRKMKKFSEGGKAGRAKGKMDRRMADIESDYKKALARGKSEKEARAKRAQREADARDDYAKRTGADRTATRAAEKAAEARLTAARRSPDKDMKAVSVASTPSAMTKIDMPKAETSAVGKKSYDDMSFRAAFAQAMKDKGKGETFSWKGKSYKLESARTPTPKPAARTPTPKPAAPAPADTSGKGKGAPDATTLLSRRGSPPAPTTTKPAAKPAADAKSAGPRLGGTLPPPVEIKAPLRGIQAIAERRRRAEQSRVPPPSDAAKSAAELRRLGGAKFAKGGKIDGCAIRGKTRAKRTR